MSCRVSILVPVYGVEQYMERCARSLFDQTYPELEYVFVNDCTPDESMEVLARVMKDYPERKGAVSVINHEKNCGLAAARNTGVANATGDFVCLVDSDDWMELDAVELLVKKQTENNADLVSGNRMIHYPERDCLFEEQKCQNNEEMTLRMMQRNWDHFITGRLLRRSLFLDYGLRWNEGLDVAEDRYMMTRLAYHAQRLGRVDAVVYHYERCNENALTKTSDKQRIFRNNEQELRNVLSLKRFFEDKEEVFQKECSRCVTEQLMLNMRVAVAYSSKDEYNRIANLLEEQGQQPHSYRMMRLVRLKEKAIRFLRRRWK